MRHFHFSSLPAISPSPSAHLMSSGGVRPLSRGVPIMTGSVRAIWLCAVLALGLVQAHAADKAFRRDDLADSAIKLEARIKSEAGPAAKSTATLRTDADAAFRRGDARAGL